MKKKYILLQKTTNIFLQKYLSEKELM